MNITSAETSFFLTKNSYKNSLVQRMCLKTKTCLLFPVEIMLKLSPEPTNTKNSDYDCYKTVPSVTCPF